MTAANDAVKPLPPFLGFSCFLDTVTRWLLISDDDCRGAHIILNFDVLIEEQVKLHVTSV